MEKEIKRRTGTGRKEKGRKARRKGKEREWKYRKGK